MPLSDVLQESFFGLWTSIVDFLPRVIGAIVIFIIGWVIALILRSVIVQIVKFLRIDELAARLELKSSCEKAGIKLHIGNLLGWIIKWFFIIFALIAATDVLGWQQVTLYLKEVVMYLPNVIIAVIILLAGILLGNFVGRIVKSAVEAAKLASADFLAGISKWAIFIFTLMAALVQLQIAPQLIQVLFTGLVAMLALAGGLAFGLGGKEHAAKFLERLKKDISSHS
ncbi:MAG: hypothetical protein ABIH21_02495 [Patescibacteria group bacterium]